MALFLSCPRKIIKIIGFDQYCVLQMTSVQELKFPPVKFHNAQLLRQLAPHLKNKRTITYFKKSEVQMFRRSRISHWSWKNYLIFGFL